MSLPTQAQARVFPLGMAQHGLFFGGEKIAPSQSYHGPLLLENGPSVSTTWKSMLLLMIMHGLVMLDNKAT